MPSTLENTAAIKLIWRSGLPALICCVILSGCRSGQTNATPSIEFIGIPLVDEGGTGKIAAIEGRVVGASSGQRIVLYARSGNWYIQPFTDQPFTEIQPDSTWRNSTHLGTEYAALLVEPGYLPPAVTSALPDKGGAVVAVAIVPGEVRMLVPVFWQTWWFRISTGLACLFALFAFHRFRVRQLTGRLNARFEERLAERTRIAQEIHDTLLQDFISASMYLHIADDLLPEESPAKPPLNRVQQLMAQVIDGSRNTVRGLRLSKTESLDLEQAFSRIWEELGDWREIAFRVIVEGKSQPLHPIIRDEVYGIGREALVNAFRHSKAKNIEVGVEYAPKHLQVIVRDDGCGIDPQTLQSGRHGHWGLTGMRERAEKIGARLKFRSQVAIGTEVALSVPSYVAFQNQSSVQSQRWPLRWFARSSTRKVRTSDTTKVVAKKHSIS
jgi:signal transduction histidine kinase